MRVQFRYAFVVDADGLKVLDITVPVLSPILAIALFQLSLVSLASALEDIFNPRLRSA